ncbi:hypothetical protein DIPPA_29120 [Diplonema papillatum]|nr:hypothetical protein DIPPA_29120 [Diplonema papillatum]
MDPAPVMLLTVSVGAGFTVLYFARCFSTAPKKVPMSTQLQKLLPAKGEAGYKEVSKTDLQRHTYPDEDGNGGRCWIMLYGVIFDLTDYLDFHPGPRDVLVDRSVVLGEWARGASTEPDSAEEFEPFHGPANLIEVAGKTGLAGEVPVYVGHFVP